MAWIDGLDIPFSYYTESQFFEFGREQISAIEKATPQFSRSERLWRYPGLKPVAMPEPLSATPLLAYRWADTDRALAEQLALEDEGHAATLSPGHAAVRFTNPTNGRDVLPTMRCEMHRLRAGVAGVRRPRHGPRRRQAMEREPRRHVRRAVVAAVFDGRRSGRRRAGPVPLRRRAHLRGAARAPHADRLTPLENHR
jgi:gentisate 1,2-dioxygenase